jgi:hypothetical protein
MYVDFTIPTNKFQESRKYFCPRLPLPLMGELLTIKETWKEFWAWLKTQPAWKEMSRAEKQYMDKTNRGVKAGQPMSERVRRILDKYAPGRYEFVEGFMKRGGSDQP